jgi:glycerol uptake facilitator-like aquaporin
MNANLRSYVTEMIGTFAVVLLTAGVVCASGMPALQGQPGYSRLVIAIAQGAAWAVALAFTVRQSGGFLNPAITVTLWVFQRIDNRKAIGLIVAQFLGGAFAGLALRGLFFSNERALLDTRLGTPHLNRISFDVVDVDRATVLQGIGIEAVLMFVLTFTVFALIFDPRFRSKAGEHVYRLSYLWLGLLVAVEVLVAYDLTGAGLNPARWFGTVIWETTVDGLQAQRPFADHGPYWIGPILGALLAGMLYTYLLLPADTPKGPPKEMP